MRPSSSLTLIWNKSVALIAPFRMGISYCLPVRLSIIVSVSEAMGFTFQYLLHVAVLFLLDYPYCPVNSASIRPRRQYSSDFPLTIFIGKTNHRRRGKLRYLSFWISSSQQTCQPFHVRKMTDQHDRLLSCFQLALGDHRIILRQQAVNLPYSHCRMEMSGKDFGCLFRS